MGIISAVLQIDDGYAIPRAWVGEWEGYGGQKIICSQYIVWKNKISNSKYGK